MAFGIRLLVLGAMLVVPALGDIPEATLFTDIGCEGDSLVLDPQHPIPDLADFTNRTKSVLLVGPWIFYGHPNYNLDADLNQRMSFSAITPTCFNTYYNVSSLRVIGNPEDYRASTITLFDSAFFTGAQQVIKKNTQTLTTPADRFDFALGITGSSAWTFFSETNYTGVAKCYQPGDSYLVRFQDVTAFLNPRLYWSDAKSIRKGCHVEKGAGSTFH